MLGPVTLSVPPGALTAVVGPDGAGKTTLLRILAGLLRPDGATPASARPGLSVGYMPQKFGLYEDLSVRENLDLYADIKGVPRGERPARYARLLRMCAMEPFTERLAGRLSGGMKQKLGLICTLVSPPDLLLLDEPTVGVDPLSRRELWDIVGELTGEGSMAVVVATSYMDEAERAGQTLFLDEGEVLACGAPQALSDPARGMSWTASPAPGDTVRALQTRLLEASGVVDAVPRGGQVHFIAKDPAAAPIQEALARAACTPGEATLEDGFMVLLKARHPSKESREQGSAATTAAQPATQPAGQLAGQPGGDGPIIRSEHVWKKYGSFAAVADVGFTVRRGEVFGLLGPNGAGKTTTFNMLCGLSRPTAGRLWVDGIDVLERHRAVRSRIGYVAQKFSLYGLLSVRENLEFFAGVYGLGPLAARRRIAELSAEFGLAEFFAEPAESLPGGLKRNLAMACALLHRPAILFLDEPTSGADPLSRRQFWRRIAQMAEGGVTVIVTTHFMEEAEYCDRILIQDAGREVVSGTPGEIRAATDTRSMEEAFIAIVTKARSAQAGEAA